MMPHGPPSDFRVEGKNLIVVNDEGRELWHYTFDVALMGDRYPPGDKPRLASFGDLNRGGQPGLLFVAKPLNTTDVGDQLLCFGAGGRIRWRFTPGRPVTDGGGERMVPPYFTSGLQTIEGRTLADTRIAVSSNHYLEYPNQVAFLDVQGRVVGEYWHPGHLRHLGMADLDHNGRKLLLLTGVNNGNHQATLVVLDPLNVVGPMTPKEMRDHRFELLGMPPAKERAVVFFPRSCISLGQPYTRAGALRVTKDRVIVEVAEGVAEAEGPGFVYEFDHDLGVLNVTPQGLGVMQAHQALEARGLLDHHFSQEECERLKAGVVVIRDGQR
jgi:hypothetical protein